MAPRSNSKPSSIQPVTPPAMRLRSGVAAVDEPTCASDVTRGV
jgi:hypothetical protein